jgi:hypothetical protein
MHDIEPFYKWREEYAVEEDERSPFFEAEYNEPKQIYNYLIHPLWDDFGSDTLFLKVLFADYDIGYAILELIGEWNDAVENDIMNLKRHVIEPMLDESISKFILICENVLNFHGSDDEYYAEWAEECQDSFNGGWIAFINTFDHVNNEMRDLHLDNFAHFGIAFNGLNWRPYAPLALFKMVEHRIKAETQRLNGH